MADGEDEQVDPSELPRMGLFTSLRPSDRTIEPNEKVRPNQTVFLRNYCAARAMQLLLK